MRTLCRLVVDGLPAEVRAELFDQLFPQQASPESQHPHDVARRQFENPFSFIRMTTHSTERLRRHIAKALAALATDHDRQDRLWKATQQIAVSGSSIDVNTVGDVGFALAKAGYAAQLPWAAMACGSDANMRSLAAALIPYMPEVDAELATNMASDPHRYGANSPKPSSTPAIILRATTPAGTTSGSIQWSTFCAVIRAIACARYWAG